MDKNALKKYAIWARNELIKKVTLRANILGLDEKTDFAFDNSRVQNLIEKKQYEALLSIIKRKGIKQTIEEVAYTWFNRFTALRFMEANGYLPSHIRVFSNENNEYKPQILEEAINLDSSDFPNIDFQKIIDLKQKNKSDELFKYLVILQCNALNSILPVMFQPIEDYTEILFPDNLLDKDSVLHRLITEIPEEEWKETVQIIGWLYQYYNSELKDKVFEGLKKNKKIGKENIPVATQLFTPDWIVRYMVENSLGRLWLEGHSNSNLKLSWRYYLEEAEQDSKVKAELEIIKEKYKKLKPEDIRCIDPCMGSGHILCYMFDLLMQIYEEAGYSSRDAVENIINNNLYGLDIDERATQLAYFTVMMKARQYDRRFFSRSIQPKVYAICESNGISQDVIDCFVGSHNCHCEAQKFPHEFRQKTLDDKEENLPLAKSPLRQLMAATSPQGEALERSLKLLLTQMTDASEYGSLITVSNIDFKLLYERIEELKSENSSINSNIINQILPLIQVAYVLAQKYDVVITNPPYMGVSGMNQILASFMKEKYPNTKTDLFSAFLEHGLDMANTNGYSCMVTMQNWMFLPSFEKLRKEIINEYSIISLLHMENMVMGIAFGTAVSIIRKNKLSNYKANFNHIKYTDIKDEVPFEFPVLNNRFAKIATEKFNSIPGSPIAYWIDKKLLDIYNKDVVGDKYEASVGIQTGDNDRFLKYWFEVSLKDIDFNKDENTVYKKKWYPHPKGGAFQKWYGNYDYVVDWQNDGERIKIFNNSKTSIKKYNRDGICWSHTTNGAFSARVFYKSSIPNLENPVLFCKGKEQKYLLALLNSKVANYLLNIVNSTMHYHVRDVLNLPLLKLKDSLAIENVSDKSIELVKSDWDSYEYSWNFTNHPLCRGNTSLLSDSYSNWENMNNKKRQKLIKNEEYLNEMFINLYGLQDSVSSKVEEKFITIKKADKEKSIKSFLSYAVGCMFGRYSLDCNGLAYAGGEWETSKYIRYIPEPTNIIPINDNEYFSNDILIKLENFLAVIYGKENLENNLNFIAQALSGKGTSRQIIKNYFLNSFYEDHCRVYQKRPIYWLFDSGKKNSFKCLIYIHRYRADTIARIRTDYIHAIQAKYNLLLDDYRYQIENSHGSTKIKLTKTFNILYNQAEELRLYEEKIHHLADSMISINLDDGVKHNYALFETVLAKIK